MSDTPILDLECEPPAPRRPRLLRLVGLLIGFLIGVMISSITILGDEDQLPDWHWPAFNVRLLVPALYVAIGVHELGHLLAGVVAGFDSGGISIGGFMLLKSGKNWAFR